MYDLHCVIYGLQFPYPWLRSALLLGPVALLPTHAARRCTLAAFEGRCIHAGSLRSALLLGPVALLPTHAARRCTLAAFEGRCIHAGSLRFCVASWANGSAMRPAKRLASPALRPSPCSPGRNRGPLRRALPVGRPANRTPTAFARRSIPAGPLRSALLLGPIALRLLALRRALPAGRFAGLGARPGLSTDRQRFAALGARARLSTDCYVPLHMGCLLRGAP